MLLALFLTVAPVLYALSVPSVFEENRGQFPPAAHFVLRSPGRAVLVESAALQLLDEQTAQRLEFRGARQVRPVGERLNAMAIQNLTAPGPRSRAFGAVRLPELYPGIDIVIYTRTDGALEFDLYLRPGARLDQVRIRPSAGWELRADGTVLLAGINLAPPVSWQTEPGGKRRPVATRFRQVGAELRFEADRYEPTLPLTVDPVVVFTRYVTPNASTSVITMDPAGNVYVGGNLAAIPPSVSVTNNLGVGNGELYIAKINPRGEVVYRTTFASFAPANTAFLSNFLRAITVDALGQPTVTGQIYGESRLALRNATQATAPGNLDVFVTKLNAGGDGLIFSTYLGAGGNESASAIATDSAGNIYVGGSSRSGAFPVSEGYTARLRDDDAFLTKYSATGQLAFTTFLGGEIPFHLNPPVLFFSARYISAITVDSSGNIYAGGYVNSFSLPTVNAFQTQQKGDGDAFLVKLEPTGKRRIFCTYLGGSGNEVVRGLAVDTAQNVYIAGQTHSADFPVRNALYPVAPGGLGDSFLSKFGPAGELIFSTYFGSGGEDDPWGLALDPGGNPILSGTTSGNDIPLLKSLRPSVSEKDYFLARMRKDGRELLWSTLLGGSKSEGEGFLGVGSQGQIVVGGSSNSRDVTGTDPFLLPVANSSTTVIYLTTPITALPAAVTFTGGSTMPPPAQTVSVQTTAGEFFSVVVAPGTSGRWLSASPASGRTRATEPVEIILNRDVTATLAPGSYSARVTFTTEEGATIVVPVTLDWRAPVFAPGPLVSSVPSVALRWNRGAGPQPNRALTLSAPAGPAQFQIADVPAWLDVTPLAGITPAVITLKPRGQEANGLYTGSLSITAPTAPQPLRVPVGLTVAAGAPVLTRAGVVSGATLTAGVWTPNQILSLFGSNLECAAGLEMPGVTVLAVTPGQLNIATSGSITGTASALTYRCAGESAAPISVENAPAQPGLFVLTGTGKGQAAALNQDGTVNGTVAAKPGEVVVLFGTGFGAYQPADANGWIRLREAVAVHVDGQLCEVLYAGQAPGATNGLQQINIVLPPTLPTGPALPVVAAIQGLTTQSAVTIRVE